MPTPPERIAPEALPLDGVVCYWASRAPDQIALEYFNSSGADQLTWLQFERNIAGAAQLLHHTVNPGEPIAVVCSDSLDFHITVNALWRLGAGVVLVDRTWGPAIVADLLRLTGCRVIFHADWTIEWPVAERPVLYRYPPRTEADTRQYCEAKYVDAIALYATTSGTTDNPKCVAISHRRIRTAYRICLSVHDFTDIKLSAALFQLNSLGILGVCFLLPREVGASTRAFPTFSLRTIRTTWHTVLEGGTDFVYLVPPLVRLLGTLPAASPVDGRRVLAFCAAAPVRQHELRRLEERFPVRVFNAYGLTELTFAVFFGCREADGLASESIGYPVGLDAQLVTEAGDILEGPGVGELHLKGPMLTDGYVHNPSATKQTWQEGWFKTGDLAERDATNRYFIRGRLKDVIFRGGITYYLYELEHYIRRVPDVVDVCAFQGRELPSGDELCAIVQVSNIIDRAVLLERIRQQIGEPKMPDILYMQLDSLPRNSNGKILRQVLREQHLNGRLTDIERLSICD